MLNIVPERLPLLLMLCFRSTLSVFERVCVSWVLIGHQKKKNFSFWHFCATVLCLTKQLETDLLAITWKDYGAMAERSCHLPQKPRQVQQILPKRWHTREIRLDTPDFHHLQCTTPVVGIGGCLLDLSADRTLHRLLCFCIMHTGRILAVNGCKILRTIRSCNGCTWSFWIYIFMWKTFSTLTFIENKSSALKMIFVLQSPT